MSDPFLITGPALISFSGGRTSAYMLWRILQAHGGTLPDDMHVCFANTGKEREETLRFVHECATRWDARVRWLEWRPSEGGKRGRKVTAEEADGRFEEVGYNSASRDGEPFTALIQRRGYVPNSVTRFCTPKLKIDTQKHFMLAQGYDRWTNAVGLRADEEHRARRQIERNLVGNERFTAVMPLWKAGVTKQDVDAFWAVQEFDLGLQSYEGNCDLCFLKGCGKLRALIRENPGMADWWIAMERLVEATAPQPSVRQFHSEFSYAALKDEVSRQGFLFDINEGSDPEDEHDAECGTWCTGEAA